MNNSTPLIERINKMESAPRINCGTISIDRNDWNKVYFNTPIGCPNYGFRPHPWQILPGSPVKAVGQPGNMGDMVCGRLSYRGADRAVVLGHGWTENPDERFVWRGTREEFDRIWEID